MQISAANLIAAQQAAQAALAAKQATKAAAAPAFSLSDLSDGAAPLAQTEKVQKPVAAQPQAGARLGQHINIVI